MSLESLNDGKLHTAAALNAAFAARGGAGLLLGLPVMASRSAMYGSGVYYNANNKSGTYRTRHVATGTCSDLRLVFGNWIKTSVSGGGTEGSNINRITVAAAIEVSGTSYPVFFRGARSADLDPDAVTMSDPCAITIPSGTTFYVKTYVSVIDPVPPTVTLGATASSGGSFAAGTYYWKVTSTNANGETIGSNEVTATLAANGTQALSWAPVLNATGYKVYRGTAAGGENTLTATLGMVYAYTDTGAAGSGATVPTSSNAYAQWPVGIWPLNDGQQGAVFNSDLTLTSQTSGWAQWNCYHPLAIVGTPQPGSTPWNVALVGDSITQGYQGNNGTTEQYTGWAATALLNASKPYVNLGVFGELALNWNSGDPTRYRRAQLLGSSKYALCAHGHNDIEAGRSFAQIQADLLAIWNYVAARGIKVYAATITPRTTSTDSWATTANQAIAGSPWSQSVRTQLNDWIRTVPAPLSGYIDAADAAETSRNSGIWKAGYTGDGIHPNATGVANIAPVLNPSVFV